MFFGLEDEFFADFYVYPYDPSTVINICIKVLYLALFSREMNFFFLDIVC